MSNATRDMANGAENMVDQLAINKLNDSRRGKELLRQPIGICADCARKRFFGTFVVPGLYISSADN
jgi:hypothetical protein